MPTKRLALVRLLRDVEIPPMVSSTLPEFADVVSVALSPQVTVTRFGRVWRLSRPNLDDGWLTGKLGFERIQDNARTFYDEALQDFVTEDSTTEAGTFSHYALDLRSQYLIFDYRPPDIRIQSFVGALQQILNSSSMGHLLEVEPVFDSSEFFSWVQGMDRVLSVRVTVRRPNPSFEGRPERIRQLLEETRAARILVEAAAPARGDGLEVEGTDIATLAPAMQVKAMARLRRRARTEPEPGSSPLGEISGKRGSKWGAMNRPTRSWTR